MNQDDLDKWRKRVPWYIFALALLPWIYMSSKSLSEAKPTSTIVGSTVALIAAFFYVASGVRNFWWDKEKDQYVGKQIREYILDLVPQDLHVTEAERKDLSEKEILGNLTGVFWEAVDTNRTLKSHKSHFYSNGIVYSTALDVYLILSFAAILYTVAALVNFAVAPLYVATYLLAVALASRFLLLPLRRKRHLELSSEQLGLLRREQSEFVERRFRETIQEWRAKRQADPANSIHSNQH